MTKSQALKERERRLAKHKKAGKTDQWLKSWMRGWRMVGEKRNQWR